MNVMRVFKLDRVKSTILLVLACIYVLPIVAPSEWLVWSYTLVAAVIAVAAVWKKAWTDAVLAVAVGGSIVWARLFFETVDDATLVLRTAAVLAFFLLHVTLLIGPWSHFSTHIRRVYGERRHIGVSAFFMALLHASFVLRDYFSYSFAQAFASSFVFFGFTALFIITVLACTSWDVMQKHINSRSWAVAHTVLLAVYVGWLVFAWQTAIDITPTQRALLISFILLWLLFAPWSVSRLVLRRVNGWKQLHVLVYIAYISVISHVWTGVAVALEPWLQAAFWTMVAAVVTSHAVGWVMMARQYVARHRAANTETMMHDGATHVRCDAVEQFTEGKGRRFDFPEFNGLSVAVFKHSGEFFALTSRCPHQGGPLADGTIVDGYVVCPWHKFQFGVKDGFGPAEFKDCAAYYPTIVRNGQVYVSTKSTGACKH